MPAAVYPNAAVPFDIVFEDAHLLVVNKPAGVVTQPGKGHLRDALLNGLYARYGNLLNNVGPRRDFGLLHRLDRDASGLLVVAMRPNAYDALRANFAERTIEKDYLVMVAGNIQPPSGMIQARLKEIVAGDKKKVLITAQGQEAVSEYKVLAQGPKAALALVRIKTGRLHQIRAHMMFRGHPVLGDTLYGTDDLARCGAPAAPRLALHAARLGFTHPETGEWQSFTAALPADLAAYAARLNLEIPTLGPPNRPKPRH